MSVFAKRQRETLSVTWRSYPENPTASEQVWQSRLAGIGAVSHFEAVTLHMSIYTRAMPKRRHRENFFGLLCCPKQQDPPKMELECHPAELA